ncbi:proteasome assembly chaperone 1 [Solenopsis invicta]|uniref:proteasome assembly chaperone 1 n=1 Tax=Solenopsis invicta TaxID=13686 RepID=UPI00059627B7|nr:proteasome assembly chaperone 1 [Solenopsis invicta]XP_011158100.1 proteasome assembly chaperone 1 [Solenopsis invicta]XP_011158101.1 proteasome assembly chaperone 1 [Solenopsis invicta]XP_039306062.1 proteasome assembly chaperone 1 [Solenopsis invicta]
MVSYFGEVIFPSSRAFWDDEDEYESADNTEHFPKLYVHWSKPKPKCLQKLIIIEGDPLIPFVEQCLCSKMEEACIIENEKHKKVSVIYQINKQIYICIVLPQFDTKNAGKFINEINDLLLNLETTTSIICRHISQFQNTNVPEIPSFLRILATKTTNFTKCGIEPLEQPNIVFGVGAGILSYAELLGIPAKSYILYIDSFVLDSKCVEPILQVLTDEIPCKLQQPKFVENSFSKGNLYM